MRSGPQGGHAAHALPPPHPIDLAERRRRQRVQARLRQLSWRLPAKVRGWLLYLAGPAEIYADTLLLTADMLDEWRAVVADARPELARDLQSVSAELRDEAPLRARHLPQPPAGA